MGNPYKLGNPHFSKFEEKLKRLHPLGDPTKRNKNASPLGVPTDLKSGVKNVLTY